MKNKLFVIIDTKNDVYVNSLISINQELAKNQIVNNIKQQIYIFQNTTNLAQKANILGYLSTCQDFELHEICDGESELITKYSEILKPYEKILKLNETEVKNAIKQSKKTN